MDQVLCIDLSSEPARVALVGIEQRKLSVLQSEQFSLAEAVDLTTLSHIIVTEPRRGESGGEIPADGEQSQQPETREAWAIEPLVEAISRFPDTWTNSVLIAPMNEYLSLNLTLPFGDTKSLLKILDLEVQDVVPFEVEEFAVEGHSLSALGPGQFDIHVSLAPKRFIRNLLLLCQASGIDPSIVTTPCSALAVLPHLAPDYFRDTYALISITPQGVYICAAIDGLIRADKTISAKKDSTTDSTWFMSELKLAILAWEKKYARTFNTVYVSAGKKIIAELQQTLGRNVETLELADFISSGDKTAAPGALPALFADNDDPIIPLSNFRVREFSFRPNWGALIRALGGIRHYLLGALGLFLLSIFLTYQIRELQISRLQDTIREQLKATIPNLTSTEGQEMTAFKASLDQLTKELESIGSSSEGSPMNILIELTKDFAALNDVTLNDVDIRTDRVLLDVTVPDYAAADRVERALKKKRDLYRRIRKDASNYNSSNNGINFNFELKLQD